MLDDRVRCRRHVTLFVGEEQVDHVTGLQTPVDDDDTISVYQALSGG